mgnify:FL=1
MGGDPFDHWIGEEMNREETEELLYDAGWGILSLARDGVPYSIPISFGYTGEDVYFALIRSSPDDEKFEYIDRDGTARLMVTDIESRYDWRSVAVTGPVEPVGRDDEEWTDLLDSMEENAWFASDYRFASKNVGLQGWRIEPERVEGFGL